MTLKGHNLDVALAVLAAMGLAISLSLHEAQALDQRPPLPVEYVQTH